MPISRYLCTFFVGKVVGKLKEVLRIMVKEYNLKGEDFMGYKLERNNPYTYHHIKKKCQGGEETQENGAILTKVAHEYLHIIECREWELYYELNKILKEINMQKYRPTDEQLLAIDYLLSIFEKEHKKDKTSKGKTLIKREYIEKRRNNGKIFRIN